MEIREITGDKRRYLPLLLVGDEQEEMVMRYLPHGSLFVCFDPDPCAVAVVADEGDGCCELKNLAVEPCRQRQGHGGICIRLRLLLHRRKQLVALLPVAPEMRQLQVGEVAGVAALGHRNDVVDARRKRMRKLAAEIHRFAADAAHGLCSIDLLFVALKGQTVRAVTVWARNSLWHMRLLGHGLLCTIGKEPLQAGGLLRGGSVFKAHGCFAGPGVSKKPPGRSERQDITKKPG